MCDMNKLLTIVTITYNRRETIKRLVRSLKNQSRMNFQWLIIDDGSTDGTSDYIKFVQKKEPFPIKLIRNSNRGKYKEINYSLSILNTKLMIIIDSDDYLIPRGAELIEEYWQKYSSVSDIGSMIFERGKMNEDEPIKTIDHEFIDRRYYYLAKAKKYGDYSDVFVTDAVANYRFPEFKKEKFMSEGPLYYYLSQRKLSVFIPKVLTVGSYLNNGLTKNIRYNQVKNYKGTLYETNLYLDVDTPFLFRIKKAILYNYVALCCPEKFSRIFKRNKHKGMLVLCLLPAILVYIKNKYEG